MISPGNGRTRIYVTIGRNVKPRKKKLTESMVRITNHLKRTFLVVADGGTEPERVKSVEIGHWEVRRQ